MKYQPVNGTTTKTVSYQPEITFDHGFNWTQIGAPFESYIAAATVAAQHFNMQAAVGPCVVRVVETETTVRVRRVGILTNDATGAAVLRFR